MRISDWSSEVCSSDLRRAAAGRQRIRRGRPVSRTLPPPRFDDPAAFGRVAVLMGGTTSEREVSLDSGRNVLAALRARGVEANSVDGIPTLARELQDKHFDRVFNVLHGGAGESRSEERRVGTECVSTCQSLGSRCLSKKKKQDK